MTSRLEVICQRYEQISEMLTDMAIISDIKKLTELSKEQRSIEKIVFKYREVQQVEKDIADLKEMLKDSDPEIREMAELELPEAESKKVTLDEELKILLLPKDPNDEKNVIVEIRGAAGGDEANIFAGDLYRMYSRYAESKGWKNELIDAMPSEMGGYSQIEFKISGDMVYSLLKIGK